jgi:hypothetical protein
VNALSCRVRARRGPAGLAAERSRWRGTRAARADRAHRQQQLCTFETVDGPLGCDPGPDDPRVPPEMRPSAASRPASGRQPTSSRRRTHVRFSRTSRPPSKLKTTTRPRELPKLLRRRSMVVSGGRPQKDATGCGSSPDYLPGNTDNAQCGSRPPQLWLDASTFNVFCRFLLNICRPNRATGTKKSQPLPFHRRSRTTRM